MIRRMGLTVMVAALVALMVGCGSGRRTDYPVPPMDEVEAMVDLMRVELDLDQAQAAKARQIVRENAEMKPRIDQAYRGRPIEFKDAHRERLEKFQRQVEAILREDQLEAFDALYRAIKAEELMKRKDDWRDTDPNMNPGGGGIYGY